MNPPGARPFDVDVTAHGAGLRVVTLAVGGRVRFATGDDELLVLPLAGGCDVACDDERLTLTGRRSVFSRVTDVAYLPRGTTATLRAPNGGRFALPAAHAGRDLPFRYGAAEDVPVDLSGPGQVSDYTLETDRLLVREVLVPGGHRSPGANGIRYFDGRGHQVVRGRPVEVGPGDVVLVPDGDATAAPGLGLYHLTVSARPSSRESRQL